MSFLGFAKHSFINFRTCQLAYVQSIRRHYHKFNTLELTDKIVKLIEEIPTFQAIKGKKVNLGNYLAEAHGNTFAEWYLYYANEFGEDKAIEYLDKYFTRDNNTALAVLWIRGISIEKTFELMDGISIVPLSEMPISDEKILYENIMSDELPFHSLPQCALVGYSYYPKLESNDGTIATSGVSHEQLNDMALSINLIKDIICAPYLSTTYPIDIPSLITAKNSTVHQGYITSYSNGELKEEHIKDIKESYQCLRKLSIKQRNVFKISINRLLLSKCQNDLGNKILDLCIALEMLLLNDNNNAGQLSLSFRLRGSRLIGETVEKRKEYYKKLRDIYDYRSKVAHTGILTDDEDKYKELAVNFPNYLDLAEQIIKKLLKENIPDWTDLLLK